MESNTVNMSLSRGHISEELRGRVHRHLGKSIACRWRMGRAWGAGTERVGWGSEVGGLIWGQVNRAWVAIRTHYSTEGSGQGRDRI